ncbi:hypothetical protein LAD67_13030 [Escherichia coli]|nr:hypothetical protein [Escherichia coli]
MIFRPDVHYLAPLWTSWIIKWRRIFHANAIVTIGRGQYLAEPSTNPVGLLEEALVV